MDIKYSEAQDILSLARKVINESQITWVSFKDLFFMRSTGSSSRAIARIWGFPKIWQLALQSGPKYIIEVISEKFDCLPDPKKYEVIAHELNHIPRNFSGALLPHTRRGKNSFHKRLKDLLKSATQGDTLRA